MRKRKIEELEIEGRVKEALYAIKLGRVKSIFAAAKEFNVPRDRLYRRVAGYKSRSEARNDQQLLTKMEEIELVRWIKQCTIVGYPVSYQMLREMAVEIQYKRVANINNQTIESVSYDPIGEDWIRRFIDRHTQLETPRGRRIEAARLTESSKPILEWWFDHFGDILAMKQIDPS